MIVAWFIGIMVSSARQQSLNSPLADAQKPIGAAISLDPPRAGLSRGLNNHDTSLLELLLHQIRASIMGGNEQVRIQGRTECLPGTWKNWSALPVECPLAMGKSVLERVCMGKQAYPVRGAVIFRGSRLRTNA